MKVYIKYCIHITNVVEFFMRWTVESGIDCSDIIKIFLICIFFTQTTTPVWNLSIFHDTQSKLPSNL